MKRGGAPVRGIPVNDIIDEGRELGPEGKAQPEKGIDWDGEKKTNNEAGEAGINNISQK